MLYMLVVYGFPGLRHQENDSQPPEIMSSKVICASKHTWQTLWACHIFIMGNKWSGGLDLRFPIVPGVDVDLCQPV